MLSASWCLSSGVTIFTLSYEASTTSVTSIVSFKHFMPTQRPEYLLRAHPLIPKSNISCTPAGERIGIIASTSAYSDWCSSVELSAEWSSPIATSTPPYLEVPARFECLNTSPHLSTPGPLPYQRPKTPSYFPSFRNSVCCEPQTAVAARSSFKPY